MYEVVSGAPDILRAGEPRGSTASHYGQRHPRTGLGLSEDGSTLYLVTVDGRSSRSIGVTVEQLGRILRDLGAHHAVNLDGGGSTTMWLRGSGAVNSPSDGSQRVVANHLGVVVDRDVDPQEPSWCCDAAATDGASASFADVAAGDPDLVVYEALDAASALLPCSDEPRMVCAGCRATRGETLAMLVRALGLPPAAPASPTFSGVPSDHPYFGEIERAAADDITNGCGGGRVCAERPIVRSGLAVFAVRAAGLSGDPATVSAFTDVSPDGSAAAEIAAAVEACLMEPCAADRFCPDRIASRAEVARVVARAAGLVPDLCAPPADPDAGAPTTDAGVPPAAGDAGTMLPPAGSFGCSVTTFPPSPVALLFWIGALAATRARRPR